MFKRAMALSKPTFSDFGFDLDVAATQI